MLVSSLFGFGCSTSHPRPSQNTSECRLEPHFAAEGGYRNKRYCEILLINGIGPTLTGCVYNTVCVDQGCPADRWSALDAAALKKEFNATEIILNGPRFFMMDIISITTASKQHVNFGGVVMCPIAAINLSAGDLLPSNAQQPFTETSIDRRTEYVYFKGQPIYLLLSPDKAAYIMQAYSQIVDPRLTYDDLPTLGEHMKLPEGWKYVQATPKSNLTVRSHGTGHIIQDRLQNTYQRLGDEERAAIRELIGE
jgi:hypothetical protein